MTEVYRNVMIKPPITEVTNIVIKGEKGGELRFSLVKRAPVNYACPRDKKQPLLVNYYRTRELGCIDVSRYSGNKGEIIKIGANGDKRRLKSIMVYIISDNLELIESGKIIGNSSSSHIMFKYKTRVTHQFSEIKIICCNDFCADI